VVQNISPRVLKFLQSSLFSTASDAQKASDFFNAYNADGAW
jgi:hypothetical protein